MWLWRSRNHLIPDFSRCAQICLNTFLQTSHIRSKSNRRHSNSTVEQSFESIEVMAEEGGGSKVLKDLFSGAVGGVAQVLIGEYVTMTSLTFANRVNELLLSLPCESVRTKRSLESCVKCIMSQFRCFFVTLRISVSLPYLFMKNIRKRPSHIAS